MKQFLPFALVLVLLSSGCTVPVLNIEIPGIPDFFGPQVVEYEHDIVIIKSLEAIPGEIDAGQTTRLIAYIENVGDKSVGDTKDTPGGKVQIELYDYCQGLFDPTLSTCPSTTGASPGVTKCEIKELLPGEITQVSWTLAQKGSVDLRTVCPPDGMKVSVRYPYKTNSVTTISFIDDQELERSLEQRTYKTTDSYMVIGQGPIKPYMTVEDKQPIPVYGDARTIIQLQLKNAGSGSLSTKVGDDIGLDADKAIYIKGVSVRGAGGASTSSVLEPAMNGGEVENCKFLDSDWKNDFVVKFIGKETPAYLCKIDLSNLDDGKITKTATKLIEVSVLYDYIFTKSVQVVVNPKILG